MLGHKLVFQELQTKMEYAKPLGSLGVLVVTNNVVYSNVSGTMLEGFDANKSQLVAHHSAAAQGRVVLVHAGYRTDGTDNHCDNITNALAAFLVSAGPRSMFGCSKGWELAQGWSTDHPDFHRPLGLPRQPTATISKNMFRGLSAQTASTS